MTLYMVRAQDQVHGTTYSTYVESPELAVAMATHYVRLRDCTRVEITDATPGLLMRS